MIIIPLHEATVNLTIKALEKELFLRIGVPECLICDNGVQFKSKTKIPCEAVNKIIGTVIRCYLQNKPHNEWDSVIYQIQCAINKFRSFFYTKNPVRNFIRP